jgi:hypothetical protein
MELIRQQCTVVHGDSKPLIHDDSLSLNDVLEAADHPAAAESGSVFVIPVLIRELVRETSWVHDERDMLCRMWVDI